MSTLFEYIDLEEFNELLKYNPFETDNEEIIQDDNESKVTLFTRDTSIKDIRYSLVPIEYSATSEKGIAYVYHVKNWADPKSVFYNDPDDPENK
ncbi:hypothetical protein C1645_814894 [Glomus cerebriforme]|uniref:Uncharacterized protein n=1 Tax=Glomus cerebriforme TaxID=658196 RepID=A0A397TP82_9GLOM|nr:hypothetical protein C1645_814894 [Glomus cerebriforme]